MNRYWSIWIFAKILPRWSLEGNKLLLRWKDNLDKFAENNLGLIFNRFQVHYIRRTLSSWSVAYFKWVIITECDYWVLCVWCVFGCSYVSGRSDSSGWSSIVWFLWWKIARQIYASDMGCDQLSETKLKNCQVLRTTLNYKSWEEHLPHKNLVLPAFPICKNFVQICVRNLKQILI